MIDNFNAGPLKPIIILCLRNFLTFDSTGYRLYLSRMQLLFLQERNCHV